MRPRLAGTADIPQVMDIISEARGIMRSDGNMDQWTDGYPDRNTVEEDIRLGRGFVLCDEKDGMPVAYFAYIEGKEPTYAKIYGGAWLDDEKPYAVVHRLASRKDAHGVFDAMMAFATSRCGNIRIDTHRDNKIMRHCILAHGFRECGIIYLASGAERIAYQLIAEGEWKTRPATEEDIPLIHNLAWNIFPQTYSQILSPAQNDYMMDWMYSPANLRKQMEEEGHRYILGYLGAVPVGYISYQPQEEDLYHLQKVYVLPSIQGHHIGRKLFDAAFGAIKAEHPGPCHVELNVNRHNKALGFYEHIGMKKVREGDFPIGNGYYMNDYIMGIEI